VGLNWLGWSHFKLRDEHRKKNLSFGMSPGLPGERDGPRGMAVHTVPNDAPWHSMSQVVTCWPLTSRVSTQHEPSMNHKSLDVAAEAQLQFVISTLSDLGPTLGLFWELSGSGFAWQLY